MFEELVPLEVTTKLAALPALAVTLAILMAGVIVAVPTVGAPSIAPAGALIVIVKFKPAPAARVVTWIVAVVCPARIVPVPLAVM